MFKLLMSINIIIIIIICSFRVHRNWNGSNDPREPPQVLHIWHRNLHIMHSALQHVQLRCEVSHVLVNSMFCTVWGISHVLVNSMLCTVWGISHVLVNSMLCTVWGISHVLVNSMLCIICTVWGKPCADLQHVMDGVR